METFERIDMILEDWKDVHLVDPPVTTDPKKHHTKTVNQDLAYGMDLVTVNGLHLEFGVFSGHSINFCSSYKPNQIFHGFDSFEGLPEDWDLVGEVDNKLSSIKVKKKGHFALDQLPDVNENVALHKGFFDKSLAPWMTKNIHKDSKIAWLHLDADLYSSTIYVLEMLNDYIVPGTIIRFDDLVEWRLEVDNVNMTNPKHKPKAKYPNWREGEWKALNEWLEKYDRQVQPMWRNWHQGGGVKVIK